ncbi:lysozyme inhibitor LprI family protein [Flavobacterium sp.]|uniref:lysozyme inhibitor LprI family protein n=2 Tax=Flavobacterium sp. TaxID=239 RepID=UPI0040474A0B
MCKKLTTLFLILISSVAFSQTNAEMKEQSSNRLAKFDKELNIVYQKIMKNTSGIKKENIRKAQIAWLKYRDLHCECESKEHEGGSLESLIYIECLATMTKERVKELKIFL